MEIFLAKTSILDEPEGLNCTPSLFTAEQCCIPTPFHSHSSSQQILKENTTQYVLALKNDLWNALRKAFTVDAFTELGQTDQKQFCLLDIVDSMPAYTASDGLRELHAWVLQIQVIVRHLLHLLLRNEEPTTEPRKEETTFSTIPAAFLDDTHAKKWYNAYKKRCEALIICNEKFRVLCRTWTTQALPEQLRTLILSIPVIIYSNMAPLKRMNFENKLESLCQMAFHTCYLYFHDASDYILKHYYRDQMLKDTPLPENTTSFKKKVNIFQYVYDNIQKEASSLDKLKPTQFNEEKKRKRMETEEPEKKLKQYTNAFLTHNWKNEIYKQMLPFIEEVEQAAATAPKKQRKRVLSEEKGFWLLFYRDILQAYTQSITELRDHYHFYSILCSIEGNTIYF